MPALANFLNAELARRGWKKKDFAEAVQPCGISQSAAYLILAGGDNVQRETQESIARALGMTPAAMAVAMYHPGELAAHQVEASTAIEQVPADVRSVALKMLWGLAVQPAQRATTARADASAKRGRAALRNLDSAQTDHPETGPNDGLRKWYEHPGVLATFLNLLSPSALVPSAAS